MRHFRSLSDLPDLDQAITAAREIKLNPLAEDGLGRGKTLCLLFFNPSLRTRLSTQKAAQQLGLHTVVMNFGAEGWKLETADGTVMDQGTAEHIREAAGVVGQYADIIALRAFASLNNREEDLRQEIMDGFVRHSGRPVVNLESPMAHPLQALADGITLSESFPHRKPRVVLSWAPHPRALPHAVAHSFIELMKRYPADFTITHPEGYELDSGIAGDVPVNYNQLEALDNADVVYAKNWSSWNLYGEVIPVSESWTLTEEKLGNARFMHCLPVRRNVVVSDSILDSSRSLVMEQALNRTFSAQYVLREILGGL